MYYLPVNTLSQSIHMCLITFAYKAHPNYPLLVAANRDESYDRPTAAAGIWPGSPGLLAGKDLQAGGTWLGVTRQGRFAAITNHRNPPATPAEPASRGLLTLDFLQGDMSASDYVKDLSVQGGRYAGFNLIVADQQGMYYYSNVQQRARELAPGVYALSNALLDTDWPKAELARAKLKHLLGIDHPEFGQLRQTVASRELAADHELPDTGVGIEFERLLSAQFIVSESYGTRATTSLSIDLAGNIRFREDRYLPGGITEGCNEFEFGL